MTTGILGNLYAHLPLIIWFLLVLAEPLRSEPGGATFDIIGVSPIHFHDYCFYIIVKDVPQE